MNHPSEIETVLRFAIFREGSIDPKDDEYFMDELVRLIDRLAKEVPSFRTMDRGLATDLPLEIDQKILNKLIERYPLCTPNLLAIQKISEAVAYCLRETISWRRMEQS